MNKMKSDVYTHAYLPKLHRQKTEKVQSSPLNSVLVRTYQRSSESSETSAENVENSIAAVQNLLEYETPVTYGITIKDAIYVGQLYIRHRMASREIDLLLLLHQKDITVKPLEPGYVVFELSRKPTEKKDRCRYLRSDDGIHLSPLKVYKACYHILKLAISETNSEDQLNLSQTESGHVSLLLRLRGGFRVHLIPTFDQDNASPYWIAKSYVFDENPSSDMRWRACYVAKETRILQTISMTDNAARLKAMNVLIKLCESDWRLRSVKPYHVLTVLLHSMDFEVDNSPRWQRLTYEDCFLQLLDKLHHFISIRYLPHFFIEGVDVISNFSHNDIALLKRTLVRLLANDRDVLRAIQRISVSE